MERLNQNELELVVSVSQMLYDSHSTARHIVWHIDYTFQSVRLFSQMRSNLHTFNIECDASVRAFGFTIMYTDGVRRKKVEGNGKEYTISDLVHQLGCDSVTRIENS